MKTNELKIFESNTFGAIRTMTINGEPYFVGKDVAEVLGYSNTRDALSKHVDEDDKGVAKCDTLGGVQNLSVINESGLYSLILSSKLPTAKMFKRWVTSEILPAIRKTGMYATDELLNNPDLAIKAFTALKEEREKRKALEQENKEQKSRLNKLEPIADYVKSILNCKGLINVTQIAKDYGLSAQNFNSILSGFNVQYKSNGQWVLYSRYQDKGYTQSRTTTTYNNNGTMKAYIDTLWTQKGRLFLYTFLKKKGIIPTMEKWTTAE